MLVDPVIVRPWLEEWAAARERIASSMERADRAKSRAARTRHCAQAERVLRELLEWLRGFTVLDPACGSGNFLYLTLHALKDLEHRVQLEAEAIGLQRSFPAVGPANMRGIELNAYAAELAWVSVWIGEIQWMRRNGFQESRDPILKPLETIEGRDAILAAEGEEPEWPAADVVVGNPPFLGGKLLRSGLGGEYVEALRRVYGPRLHGEADLVCHWFDKMSRMIEGGAATGAGLVATNSIRGGRNRSVLDRITERGRIFDAWSDEPWVVDGAVVRVSLVAFEGTEDGMPARLNVETVEGVNADLAAAESADLGRARRLEPNRGVSFMGDTKNGAFDGLGRSRTGVASPAEEPQRAKQRRGAEAVDERDGRDLAPGGEVDHRLRSRHERARRSLVRGSVPPCGDPREAGAGTEPCAQGAGVLVASRGAPAGHVAGARGALALHRNPPLGETPAVRLARRRHLPGQPTDRHRARRRHHSRHPAQPFP